jgi:DNA repair exonuclease SbcCD ATPase subunit
MEKSMETVRLFELKEELESQKMLERKLQEARDQCDTINIKLTEAQTRLAKEDMDFEKLEKLTLTSMLAYLQKRYNETLEKERIEALEAKMHYDSVVYELEEARAHLEHLSMQQKNIQKLLAEYQHILKRKEEEIFDEDNNLKKIVESITRFGNEVREIDEALSAGEALNQRLSIVEHDLRQAKGWGIFDMLGGNFIADVGKHIKIASAQKSLAEAKNRMTRFKEELDDVKQIFDLNIDIGTLMTAADFFFDNLLMDFFVQNRINEALSKTREAMDSVLRALEGLEIRKNECVINLQALEANKEHFLLRKF